VRIGIITDGSLARWQARALLTIAEGNEFIVYECTNTRARRRPVAHGLYYALNAFTVRNRETAAVGVPAQLMVTERTRFAAETDGAWQRLPESLLARIAADAPAVILKFGMGLLRVPDSQRLAAPILSYHHGDPARFRGRPAGFYELLSGAPVVGQVVQILSDQLDAGAVVAFAETKAHAHSWRRTLVDAYRTSPLLLPRAIANARSGSTLPIERSGTNYRRPSNWTVLRFIARLAGAKLRRFAYGALFEKAWRVATCELPANWSPERPNLPETGWTIPPRPSRFRFLADPFFDPRGSAIFVEAMRGDGRGQIVCLAGTDAAPIGFAGGHCSYPATISIDGRHYVVAEVSDWSPPRLFELDASSGSDRGELDVPGRPRLLDPTLFQHRDAMFLFGNRADEGDAVLRLWVADSLFGAFAEHPASPIRLSPAGARMGGLILARDGRLYRPGQDLRGDYGDGALLFPIEELSPTAYREGKPADLRFASCRGPHTLNLRGSTALFDFYENRFSLLAGLRRVRQSRVG
jgi:hypothetical protein